MFSLTETETCTLISILPANSKDHPFKIEHTDYRLSEIELIILI